MSVGHARNGDEYLDKGQPNEVSAADAKDAVLKKHTHYYGSMYANNINQSIVISSINTFVEISAGISGGLCNGFTFQNAKELKCLNSGIYLINWSVSLESPAALEESEGAIMINGNAQTIGTSHAEISIGGINRPETISGSGIFSLSVNDLISLAILNHSSTNDFIVQHVSLTILQIA